jgi:hypothetical protein
MQKAWQKEMTRGHSSTKHSRDLIAEVLRRRVNNYTGLSFSKNAVHRLYSTMLQRCTNTKSPDYPAYGGRGIKVCDRWMVPNGQGFANFMADMGPRPEGKYSRTGFSLYRLARTNTDGDFCPSNCSWGMRSNKRERERQRIAWKLSKRYDWICWYCGINLKPVQSERQKNKHTSVIVRGLESHIDHIIPKVAGGTDDIDNLALACECCNRAKFNLHVDFFLEWLDRVKFGDSWTPIRDGRRSSPSLLKAS